jgi:nucleoside-diphosphate-sugar epimerase
VKIYVVGGGGYIGHRLIERLQRSHYDVVCVDFQSPRFDCTWIRADARCWRPPKGELCRVVYMASIQEPSDNMPVDVAEDIMVQAPYELLESDEVEHMVYFSSIRAVTARDETTYALMKEQAEERLLYGSYGGVTILRPGTVFGGFRDGFPVRTTTVPNRYLLTGWKPDEHYKAFVCPLYMIVRAAEEAVLVPEYMHHQRTILNVGLSDPVTARTLPVLAHYAPRPPDQGIPDHAHCSDTNEIIRRNCCG